MKIKQKSEKRIIKTKNESARKVIKLKQAKKITKGINSVVVKNI